MRSSPFKQIPALRSTARRRLSAVALACVLGGCAVGPDYRPPQTASPDEWRALPPQSTSPADPATLAAWWTTLDDPILNQLIERALERNKTAKQAFARVVEARTRRAAQAGAFWPAIGASGSVSRLDSDAPGTAGTDETYATGFDSSWELDLFGGRRRAYEAATAQLAASEADLRDTLVTLLGDVALAYVDLRTTQSRLTHAERNLEAQRGVLDLATWRAGAGLATVLDVDQARSSYEQTRAQIPLLESSLGQATNRLAVLTGEAPGGVSDLLDERRAVPVAPLSVAAGVPADVLRRRPDIRRAERRLAAQTAQVGVATAALYPSLSLTGSITLQSLSASDLLDGVQTERTGLSLIMPLFRGGTLRQNVNAQHALVDQALAAYEAAVLAAYEDVENALTALNNEQRRHEALVLAVESARRAAELALVQYNSGLVDFQTVLTADRQLISLEDALAVSDGQSTSNLIRLYRALGGGWSVFPVTTALESGA